MRDVSRGRYQSRLEPDRFPELTAGAGERAAVDVATRLHRHVLHHLVHGRAAVNVGPIGRGSMKKVISTLLGWRLLEIGQPTGRFIPAAEPVSEHPAPDREAASASSRAQFSALESQSTKLGTGRFRISPLSAHLESGMHRFWPAPADLAT
jgi:hypothetical protein